MFPKIANIKPLMRENIVEGYDFTPQSLLCKPLNR
jgi:hypothetical protein